jgi:GNAT superfamily N-acetyltransferase
VHKSKICIDDVVAFEKRIPRLAEILIDAVAGGAGVSFMHPLSPADAEDFWRGQVDGIKAGLTFPVIAEHEGETVGIVLLIKAWAPNQPHRADIAKMLVHSRHRRHGFATHLIRALEDKAMGLGLTLLTFDAVAGSGAEKFYERLGFSKIGEIPGYAYSGTGQLDGTAFFYKKL